VPGWFQAILLGLVEGLTEFIPVSSTGHLLLVQQWLGARPDWFTVFIQVGAALALLPLFWNRLFGYARTLQEPASRDYLAKLAVAFGITGAGGLLLDKLHFELPETIGPVAWATLLGGIVIIAVENWRTRSKPSIQSLTWSIAIACGVAQLVAAVFPGTSRSGITIMAAIAMGLVRAEAAEFSFILGMITLTAAGGYKFMSAWRHGEIQGASSLDLILGTLAAAVSAFLVVRWLLGFVRSHTFHGFAWYRIALGTALLAWGALR
jgi:undecaprenyl-diphosphatase